ncbi:MAG: c-type cytochrome [Acidobacteriota bacterium]
MRNPTLLFLSLAAVTGTAFAQTPAPNGENIYEARCATCHRQPVNDRIPSRADLAKLQPQQVVDAMQKGAMTAQAQGLSPAEIQAVAAFVGSAPAVPRVDGGRQRLPG